MSQLVESNIVGNVAWIRLNRPDKRNALLRETLELLATELQSVSENKSIRALVLAANGPVFCAGMDLDEMQQRAESPNSNAEWMRDSEVYCTVLLSLYSMQVPTIAAVDGGAVAGGVGMAVACDFVIATEKAFFSLPEPMRGITAAMVTPLLIHRIGPGAANRMLLGGERWSSAQGLACGLCHDVVVADRLENRIAELLGTIQSGSQQALAITKSHVESLSANRMDEMLRHSMSVSAQARETADAREGLDAFLQKRKPSWQTT